MSTKQEMIDKIYEVIAKKGDNLYYHQVKICECLDWIQKQIIIQSHYTKNKKNIIIDDLYDLIKLWVDKRSPIEENEESLTYVYNLING